VIKRLGRGKMVRARGEKMIRQVDKERDGDDMCGRSGDDK
jgi:hypothetical protein